MTTSERIARALIAKRNLNDLLGDWEATTTNNDENIDIVRGWLMDEFEARNPEAFEAWIMSKNPTDESLREYMTA